MKKLDLNSKLTRRQVLKAGVIGGAGLMMPWQFGLTPAEAEALKLTLSDPATQPKFVNTVPNALDPGFKYKKNKWGVYRVGIGPTWQRTGLVNRRGRKLWTKLFGYGQKGNYTWPGMTFEVHRDEKQIKVNWRNQLFYQRHMLPVDTNLHWAYSLHGYEKYSIRRNGIPIITHLHGGHTDFQFDGNPEWFYTPGNKIIGPSWDDEGIDFTTRFKYDVDVPAGNLWYHDHALGLTRLNVYAGMAGFFFVRDNYDTGKPYNKLGLPAFPYETALAIQDRMFKKNGRLFYPAFPGDPFYDDFITGEGATLPPELFPNGGPTALAEFFGDHMVVNGLIWPKADVERRNYRMHLLNGTDSRFMVLQFRPVAAGATDLTGAGDPLPFWVIGSDQGLASEATQVDTLVFEPGGRYDIVFDFKQVPKGTRVIMSNEGWDAPFGGDFGRADADPLDLFPDSQTDRIMAFDVVLPKNHKIKDKFDPGNISMYKGGHPSMQPIDQVRVRKVALFEGKDEFGRLQPLLGTAEPATDSDGLAIKWPEEEVYSSVGLSGQMNGSVAWHSPTTEKPALGTAEEWEIWNATGDAHPVHLHLVKFEIIGRKAIVWDSATNPEDRVLDPDSATNPPNGDGTYLVTQPTVQHNSMAGEPLTYGMGFRLVNLTTGANLIVDETDGYVENAPKDMVTALPDQVTIIRAFFDKPGKYVWHCHILSHEDHEMMRVMRVE